MKFRHVTQLSSESGRDMSGDGWLVITTDQSYRGPNLWSPNKIELYCRILSNRMDWIERFDDDPTQARIDYELALREIGIPDAVVEQAEFIFFCD